MNNFLKDFFEYLNRNCTYLVLRNWDNLLDETMYGAGHEDIDILCSDIKEFITLTGAKRVHKERCRDNYIVSFGERQVRFDVRWVGDGYYPADWEAQMLERRVLNDQFIYVMELEDYFFSLLYHALLQKPSLSSEYLQKLNKTYNLLFESSGELGEKELLELLNDYLSRNGYCFEVTRDPGVFVNKTNVRHLPKKNNIYRLCNNELFRLKHILIGYYSRFVRRVKKSLP